MTAPGLVAAGAFALWLVTLTLQLADLGTARFDSRRLARGATTGVRLHPVAWVLPFGALALVWMGVGIDFVARRAAAGEPMTAILAGSLVMAGVVSTWLVVTFALTRVAADSYRAIRDELLEHAGGRVQQEWLDEVRARLAELDADLERSSPPGGASTRSAVGWVIRRPQRLIAPAFAVAQLVAAAFVASQDSTLGLFVAVAALAVVASAALAVVGSRASLGLIEGVREAQTRHRVEVEHLLVEAGRTAKKPVAGLGDRVARALQILREQQG